MLQNFQIKYFLVKFSLKLSQKVRKIRSESSTNFELNCFSEFSNNSSNLENTTLNCLFSLHYHIADDGKTLDLARIV